MVSLELAPEYGYVVLAATSAFILNTAHTLNTGKYRKAAKVDYPAPYAPSSDTSPEAIRFNCAQRSHANYVENVVIVLPSLLIAGLKFPLTSAALGFFWTASRWSYMVGYSKGGQGGKGRYKNGGLLFWFAQLGLLGLSVYNGVTMVLKK